MSLPYELFEFAKNTGNKTYNIGDINVGAKSYVELGLGHSRQINDKLRVGAKLKFLLGVASADFLFKDVKADLASNDKWIISGTATADVSMKGFTYESETAEYNDPSKGEYEKINSANVDGAGIGGFGMAIDLGGVYKINDDWTVNAAVLDLGLSTGATTCRPLTEPTSLSSAVSAICLSRATMGQPSTTSSTVMATRLQTL